MSTFDAFASFFLLLIRSPPVGFVFHMLVCKTLQCMVDRNVVIIQRWEQAQRIHLRESLIIFFVTQSLAELNRTADNISQFEPYFNMKICPDCY